MTNTPARLAGQGLQEFSYYKIGILILAKSNTLTDSYYFKVQLIQKTPTNLTLENSTYKKNRKNSKNN
jgi:hypothetical protein